MLKIGVLLALLTSFLMAQDQPVPQFEIARHTFFDFGPPTDFYELFLVRSAQTGSTVEKITLTPSVDSCFQPAKAEVVEAFVPQTISELLGKTNPCTIPEKELRREKKRCKKCLVFSGANVSLQAHCGAELRTIRADILDRDMFDPAPHTPEHTSWTMKLLAKLDQAAGPSVMDRPIFPTLEEANKTSSAADSEALRELAAGKYDELFSGAPDKPSSLYRTAQIVPAVPTVRLLSIAPAQPADVSLPKYPPLAKQAYVEGFVSFSFEISEDGSTRNFTVQSGHPMLRGSVEDAVSHWRFPSGSAGQTVHATIQFATNCPVKK